MGRTNIVIDDRLVERAMEMYGLRTKREAVDLALRRLVGDPHEELEAFAETADGDWWARHFEAIRGHPLGE
jgi:Arc/MetJ family transcription regulator